MLLEVAADKLDAEGDKCRDQEKHQLNIIKDLVQEVMRKKLGLFGPVCRIENNSKIKDVMLGDGGNQEARKTMHRMDG